MPKQRYGLTEKDENLPEGYIGIYDIFSDSKYALPKFKKEEWCIGNKKLKQMRYETYKEVKTRFDICQADDFAKFWNGNLDAINELGLNKFYNLFQFGELAKAMICFQNTIKNKSNNSSRKMISFGIKYDIYKKYYKEQKKSIENGCEMKKVSLYDIHKLRNGNIFKIPRVSLLFETENGDTQVVKVRKNAIYNQFEFWCKANGVSKKDGLYQAMQHLMKSFPVKGLKELGAYERKCDLDYSEILIPDQNEVDTVSAMVYIPKTIHNKMREIIKRRNSDVENIGTPPATIDKYIIQAVSLLNQKSPLKYSDPVAYEKYINAKKAEQYNKAVLGANDEKEV